MRKYKDVGRRILVLILTVCMFSSMFSEVPVYAEGNNFPTNGTIVLGADVNGALSTGTDTYTYTGQEIRPAVQVQVNNVTLTENTDYYVTYRNNVNAGTASIDIVGMTDTNDWSCTRTFTIAQQKLSFVGVSYKGVEGNGEDSYVFYTGSDILPTITQVYGILSGTSTQVVLSESDYSVQYSAGTNTAVGTRSFKVVLNGVSNYKYSGTVQDQPYHIYYNLASDSVKIATGLNNVTYTGNAQYPEYTITDTMNAAGIQTSDYTASWADNTNVGKGALTITANSGSMYRGSKTFNFQIGEADLSGTGITVEFATDKYYYIKNNKPDMNGQITVKLNGVVVPASNYTIAYKNANAGSVGLNTLQITGTGNLMGNASAKFYIYDKLGSASLSEKELEYNGKKNVPDITVLNTSGEAVTDSNYTITYYKDADYTETITEPKSIGTYYVKITPKGYYEEELGTVAKPLSFNIVAKSLDKCTFKLWVSGTEAGTITTDSIYSSFYDGNKKVIAILAVDDEGNKLGTTDFTYTLYKDIDCTQVADIDLDTPAQEITEAQTYYIKVSGVEGGNYAGSEKIFTYTINPKAISPTSITITPQTYTGTGVIPDVSNITVSYTDAGLTKTIDSQFIQVVSASNNVMIGENTATVTIKLIGNYTVASNGISTAQFSIVPRKLSQCSCNLVVGSSNYDPSQTDFMYNGEKQTPAIRITDNNGAKTLGEGTDYTVTYFTDSTYTTVITEPVNVGTYYVLISGMGVYANTDADASIRTTFVITAKDLSTLTATASNVAYDNGNAVVPTISVRDGNKELLLGTDYEVEGYYSDAECSIPSAHNASGKVYVKIAAEAGSNYTGSIMTSFFIGTNLTTLISSFNVSGGTYNRASRKTAIVAAIDAKMAEVMTDASAYTITFYTDAAHQNEITNDADTAYINAGNIYFKVSGTKSFYGDLSGMAIIAKKDISELSAVVHGTYVYNGLEQQIVISTAPDMDGVILQYPTTNGYILTGSEYRIISSTSATNAGTATLTLQAADDSNYTGTTTVTYAIDQKDINDLENLKVKVAEVTYSDKVFTPVVTISYGDTSRVLDKTKDYTVSVYTDEALTTLASNADLTNAGTTYVRVTGIGNYKGFLTTVKCGENGGSNKFIINQKSIETVGVDLENKHFLFSNSIPAFSVTQEFPRESGSGTYANILTEGVDYTYTPTSVSEFKVGQQNITITGKGNYKGTRNSYFYYDGNLNNTANQVEVVLSYTTIEYNEALASGEGMKPTVEVYMKNTDPKQKLLENQDYEVTYTNNKVPGKASAIITGKKGSFWVGSYIADYSITGKLDDANITIPAQEYTGMSYNESTQPIENMVVICDGKTLVLGTDYKIKSITNAKDVSLTAPTVTIEGMGGSNPYFSGEKTANFAIKYNIGSPNLSIDLGGDVFSYTGSAVTPTPTVKYNTSDVAYTTLTEGVDYSVTYKNNINVSAAKGENGPCVVITVLEGGRLMGSTRSKEFAIDSIHLEDYEITGVADSYTYTGKLIRPNALQIKKKGGTDIIDPANYDVYYQTNAENPSTAPAGATETITVIGKGNYDGTITKTLTITTRDINTQASRTIEDQTYCGEEIKPNIKFTFNDENGVEQTLSIGTDYMIEEYKNNVNAATSTGTNAPYLSVRGMNSCTGSIAATFNILKKDVADLAYSQVEDPEYVALQPKYEPELTVYMSPTSEEPLIRDVAYSLRYMNNDKVLAANGTSGPFIRVTPKDTANYTGSYDIPFSILAKDIASVDIVGTLSDTSDTGFDPTTRNYPYKPNTTYTPNVNVKDNCVNGSVALSNGTDFTYEYSSNNNQVGTAWVKITGKGNYTGTRIEKFTIGTLLSEATVTVTGISDTVYNGLDTTPSDIKVKFNQTGEYLNNNTDYIVKYYMDKDCLTEASAIDLIHAGKIYVAIIGTENALTGYVGTVVIPYNIARKSLTSTDIEITGNDNMDYTGGQLNPVLTLKDKSTGLTIDTTQYDVSYENNVEIGTASATITATETGNYKDSITVYYKITKHDISRLTAEAIPDQQYTGDYIRPAVTIYDNGKLLVEGTDFEIVNGNNIRAGESWVIIKGLGNYDQTKNVYFNIVASLEDAIIDNIPDQLYTGNPICPAIRVACGGNTLVLDQDYTVSYANNTTIGDASITVRPKTNYYTGTIVKKFKITNSIESAVVSGIPTSVLYSGSAYTPVPTVVMGSKTLTTGVDYTVSYQNNVKVGTASVIVTGKGIYSGSKTVTFRITEKSINNCTIYAVSSQTYNGRVQTPPVVVKDGTTALVQGIDYTLSYRDNLNVGTGYVTIVGSGQYKGSVVKSFAITEQAPAGKIMFQNKNSATGTFDIVIDGVASYISSVRVPVWTRANQSDIVWYTATRIDADTFIAHVDIRNHNNNIGVFNVHVYAKGASYAERCVATTTTTFGSGYEYIFDYNYYITKYTDIASVYGNNTEGVFAHFLAFGMNEGRQGIDSFDVQSYRARYVDLRNAFGTNLSAFYNHYRIWGAKEGRVATGSTIYQNALTVYNGVDYRLVYDYNYYVNKYPDIKAAFGGDEIATLKHFIQYGMKEGRQANSGFQIGTYKQNYADLRSAYGNDLQQYYMHYISYGYREGRAAI